MFEIRHIRTSVCIPFVFIEVECGILIDRICFVSYWLRVVSLFKVVMSN